MTSKRANKKRIIYLFYRFIMPIVTVILLLGVASITTRAKLLGNLYLDLIIRGILTIWFCFFYLRLSKFSEYRFNKNYKWEKADVGPFEKYYLIGMGIFGGLASGIVTWGTLHILIPNSPTFVIIYSILNGLIIMLPMVKEYWVLKV